MDSWLQLHVLGWNSLISLKVIDGLLVLPSSHQAHHERRRSPSGARTVFCKKSQFLSGFRDLTLMALVNDSEKLAADHLFLYSGHPSQMMYHYKWRRKLEFAVLENRTLDVTSCLGCSVHTLIQFGGFQPSLVRRFDTC